MHSGRVGSAGQAFKAKHNDRNFDMSKTEHIDLERIENNEYINCIQTEMLQGSELSEKQKNELEYMDFTKSEKLFYKTYFSDWLEKQNEKHRLSRHTERIRTIEEVYNNKKTCPDETIFQYGNIDDQIEKETLLECYQEFLQWHDEKFSENIKILNFALHDDETTPHIHERKVFFYKNQDGNFEINQNKALERFYSLPEGTTKSRNNNLKKLYTADCRAKFEEIGRNHGLWIQQDRLPKRKHQEKNEYILEQQEKKIAELEQQSTQLNKVLNRKVSNINSIESKMNEIERITELKHKELVHLTNTFEYQTEKMDDEFIQKNNQLAVLEEQIEKKEYEVSFLMGKLESMEFSIAAAEQEIEKAKNEISFFNHNLKNQLDELYKNVSNLNSDIKQKVNIMINTFQKNIKQSSDIIDSSSKTLVKQKTTLADLKKFVNEKNSPSIQKSNNKIEKNNYHSR